ncbi:hypothetical protein JDN40_03205 [Rhodomicrobium vannielii ATCC 17100]|uniref:hypothetical protein n=1 Tax=Rhodomicrobium vannielii TaxID=1069 RepID=UPI001919BAF7|nr:hypothetical protein [Rhodomicrobium vannielii]MBJ7533121.1 hypothetical protein [Rhodomicrobium vannielii ATCC 17100]
MSFEAGIGAVEAVGQAVRQSAVEVQQAAVSVSDVHLAQAFETGIAKASETASLSFQATEEARRKAVETAGSARVDLAQSTTVEMRPADGRDSLGGGLSSYMETFQSRTSGYSSQVDEFVSKIVGTGEAGTSEGAKDGGEAFSTAEALRLLKGSFQFAIETQLVANASKHSTQVFNDLMKGQ